MPSGLGPGRGLIIRPQVMTPKGLRGGAHLQGWDLEIKAALSGQGSVNGAFERDFGCGAALVAVLLEVAGVGSPGPGGSTLGQE